MQLYSEVESISAKRLSAPTAELAGVAICLRVARRLVEVLEVSSCVVKSDCESALSTSGGTAAASHNIVFAGRWRIV